MNRSNRKKWMVLLLVLLALALAGCVRQAAVEQDPQPAQESAQEASQEPAQEGAQEKGLSPDQQKAILEELSAKGA